ncbi:MAG: hypothetical protein KatS3mg077_1019 [Candidatus Binatia bacterium]|nr:MAG: hypothetical protein KatS3mg077_1019 [Candidatus Binatia bacterium]
MKLNIVLLCFQTAPADLFGRGALCTLGERVLQNLAAEGVRFTRAYTTSIEPAAALVSLWSGLLPCAHGGDRTRAAPSPSSASLPIALRVAGYTTVAVCAAASWTGAEGFIGSFDQLLPSRWRIEWAERVRALGARAMRRVLRRRLSPVQRANVAFFQWLDRRPASSPFFAWLHYPRWEDIASDWHTTGGQAEIIRAAAKRLSDVVLALERRGLWENTLFVVTALRGVAEPNESDELAERAVQIPLLLRFPVSGPRGFVVEEFCQLADVAPTLAHIVGAPWENGPASGRPLLCDRQATAGPEAVVVEAYREAKPRAGARSGRLRRLLFRTSEFRFVWQSDGMSQLFDLATDEKNGRDVTLERPDVLGQFHQSLFEWLARHRGGGNLCAGAQSDTLQMRQVVIQR